MIYVCIPSRDEGPTIGLLLWKLRRVLGEATREYEFLVVDDGSSDQTAEVLESYAKALPLTIISHPKPLGYAASVEAMLRQVLERTDRPKRDCAVVMDADFSHGPEAVPELLKRIESGADLVVAQAGFSESVPSWYRWLRRLAPYLLRRLRVQGLGDLASGLLAVRLISLRNARRARDGRLLTTDGWGAKAELVAVLAQHARRVDSVSYVERHDLRTRALRSRPWPLARELWQTGRRVRLPSPPAKASLERMEREPVETPS
jgi:dolichol-phosphate mannosyltransferase